MESLLMKRLTLIIILTALLLLPAWAASLRITQTCAP
jgi:capsular polysaccharide biosynthesis protein